MAVRSLTVMYHAVSEAWEDALAVRPGAFDAQLTAFHRRGYRGATARQILERPGARRALHVTFDDAYASVANALPTLRRLGIPATIFVCTDLARDGGRLEISELDRVSDRDELRTLTWDELRELAKDDLIEVGSHTRSHAHLPALSDEELRSELRDSKQAIEDELGRPAPFIGYPFGEHDLRVREATAAAGYEAGFAAPGVSLRLDRYQLPRTGFWRDEPLDRQRLKASFPMRLLLERRAARQ